MRRRFSITAGVMVVLATTSGCIQHAEEGLTHVFTFDPWIPWTLLVGGSTAAVLGLVIRKQWSRVGPSLFISGLVAAVGIGPSMLRERVVVGPEAVSIRTGIWGLTSVPELRYASLRRVRETVAERRGAKGIRSHQRTYEFEGTSGSRTKVSATMLVDAAAPHFLRRIAELRVPINRER